MDATTYPISFLDVPVSERRTMTAEETRNFMSALMVDLKNSGPGDFSQVENTMPHATMVQRLKSVGIDLSTGAFLAMMAWTTGSPGDMVMWAYTCSQIARSSGVKVVTCNDLVEAFPFGIPTEAAREKIWDAQKIPVEKREAGMSDNYVDLIEFWS